MNVISIMKIYENIEIDNGHVICQRSMYSLSLFGRGLQFGFEAVHRELSPNPGGCVRESIGLLVEGPNNVCCVINK